MPRFAISFEKSFWDQNPTKFQQQVLSKRIHDAAVCLKLLPQDEPLPKGIQWERIQDATTINFCVEFPRQLHPVQRPADCDQFIFGTENIA